MIGKQRFMINVRFQYYPDDPLMSDFLEADQHFSFSHVFPETESQLNDLCDKFNKMIKSAFIELKEDK